MSPRCAGKIGCSPRLRVSGSLLFLVRLSPIKEFVVTTFASDRKMSVGISGIQFLSTAIAEMMPASCASHLTESKIRINV